jgi:hypothetical protein
MEEVEQVVGILPRSVKADGEVNRSVALGEALESLAEQGIAVGGLGEGEFSSGGLEIVLEEDGVVSIAGSVDADANGDGPARRGVRGRGRSLW